MTVKQNLTAKMTFDLVLKRRMGSHQEKVGERISRYRKEGLKKLRDPEEFGEISLFFTT